MSSSCYTHRNNKVWEETFGGDGQIFGRDGGDGFTGIYRCPDSSCRIHSIHIVFSMSIDLNKVIYMILYL